MSERAAKLLSLPAHRTEFGVPDNERPDSTRNISTGGYHPVDSLGGCERGEKRARNTTLPTLFAPYEQQLIRTMTGNSRSFQG